ncbi:MULTISPECIES: hypothetical protein [Bacillus]|uniref:hypothetical protein n=1 Tax=Bacillus TaxID=1386 RepID=UPI0009942525|nr:hypothetical protein [Bacillus pseudomycoides]MED4714406.1 hypothetical protein [Bacillus pseudomycoides]OOR48005.1 hypothetical protein BLX05_30165 [Bacillus pseudomycoides]
MSYLEVVETRLPKFDECDTEPIISSLTSALGIPRTVLANQEDIEIVWTNLRRTLENVKLEYRHELLARMVVSVRMGLFSAAVNDMWNTAILALRQKVKNFGYSEASSFLEREINEKKLKEEIRDKDLIDICVELGFLDDDSYFFINTCREMRNNYSSAHPSDSMLDGVELNYFMHQCTKHILSNDTQYVGFPVSNFMSVIKQDKISEQTKDTFVEKILKANDLQKSAILKMLFANYVDEKNNENVRLNCLLISQDTWNTYNENAIAEILGLYSSYMMKNSNTKKAYSERFFEKVGALNLLPNDKVASIVLTAINDLEDAHHNMDNFYNEKPFAERLAVSFDKKIPNPILKRYVYVVALCYVGNPYGTSDSASPFYEKMIKNFSLKEVEQLFILITEDNYLKYRIEGNTRCKKQFKSLVKLLNADAVPIKNKRAYESWLNK